MFRTLFNLLRPAARAPAHKRCRLLLEALEGRDCPSGGHLLVTDFDTHSVLRYNEASGAFVDTFVPRSSDGLRQHASRNRPEYYRPIKHAFRRRKILSLGSAVSVVEFNLDLCRSMWVHESG